MLGTSVQLTLRRSVEELPAIVAATDRFFSDNGIDPSARVPVDLSVEELFVNMVRYNRSARDIVLQMRHVDDGVEVCLIDRDVDPFDPTVPRRVDVDAPLAERNPNGLGLYLVSKMVDSMHYEYSNRESRITFFKRSEQAR